MKKIVLTAAATLALGLAACTPAANDAGNNATDVNATDIETDIDVNGAAIGRQRRRRHEQHRQRARQRRQCRRQHGERRRQCRVRRRQRRFERRQLRRAAQAERKGRVPPARGPFYLRPRYGKLAGDSANGRSHDEEIWCHGRVARLRRAGRRLRREDDGSPTAAENAAAQQYLRSARHLADSLSGGPAPATARPVPSTSFNGRATGVANPVRRRPRTGWAACPCPDQPGEPGSATKRAGESPPRPFSFDVEPAGL